MMKNKYKITIILIGVISFIFAIYQALILKSPHFFSLFSIGLSIILFFIYKLVSKKYLFENWKIKQIVIFFIILLFTCIIIDRMGIFLGYWTYPSYNTILNEIMKYIFEWTIALFYFMLSLLIGQEVFKKYKFNNKISFVLGLIIFVLLIGFLTETINLQIHSWKIIKMPFSNFNFQGFFIVFQTIGYWLMAIIPYIIYKFIEKPKKASNNKEKNKKSQEEMVGFVLIIVLVAIIALVFLAISIGRPVKKIESREIGNFLQASLDYTTECERSYQGDYISIKDLITECYQNQNCFDGNNSCEYLEDIYSGMLGSVYPTGRDWPTKGYNFEIYYTENLTKEKDIIISLFEGNCTGNKLGAQQLVSAYPGNIVVSLEICKS